MASPPPNSAAPAQDTRTAAPPAEPSPHRSPSPSPPFLPPPPSPNSNTHPQFALPTDNPMPSLPDRSHPPEMNANTPPPIPIPEPPPLITGPVLLPARVPTPSSPALSSSTPIQLSLPVMPPTTMNPTTMNPTTMNPTTMNPTTINPTTMNPTTMNPAIEYPIAGVPSTYRHRENKKRSRPRIVVPPFDFVPPKITSLPAWFYPPVMTAEEHDAMVGLWKRHPLSACASRKSLRRKPNEDRVFCDHHNRIYGVCDGHGVGAGQDAPTEQIAADTVKTLLPGMLLQMPVAQAFEELDRLVLAKLDKMCLVGTTVALVRVFDESRVMQVAHVGDSRVVMIGADGSVTTLTTDHSPTRQDEMQRIHNGDGFVLGGRVNGILAVSRAIGDNLLKESVPPTPDVTNYSLSDHDQLVVLGTDGLWDEVSAAEVAQCCKRMEQRPGATCVPLDLQAAADAVLAMAVERCSSDDMTVVMVDVSAASRTQ